jgi:hypothetical protein
VDVGRAIIGTPLQGTVDAILNAQGTGTSLGSMQADRALNIHDARIGSIQTRLLTLRAGLRNRIAAIAGELTGGAGNANWHGQVNFGPPRTYDLALVLNHLNVRKASAGKQPVDSSVNMRARFVGSGFDLANARARADIVLLPSTIGQVRITNGHLGAKIADRRVHTDMLLNAIASQLRAHGDVALTAERLVRLVYDMQFADLGPWIALIGQPGGGSLNLSGRTYGTLENLRTQDQLRFSTLRYGTNYVGCGSASVDMNAVGKPRMHGRVAR